MEEWQQKRAAGAGGQRLTTGFLDGSQPVVDLYELKVCARAVHAVQCMHSCFPAAPATCLAGWGGACCAVPTPLPPSPLSPSRSHTHRSVWSTCCNACACCRPPPPLLARPACSRACTSRVGGTGRGARMHPPALTPARAPTLTRTPHEPPPSCAHTTPLQALWRPTATTCSSTWVSPTSSTPQRCAGLWARGRGDPAYASGAALLLLLLKQRAVLPPHTLCTPTHPPTHPAGPAAARPRERLCHAAHPPERP